MEPEKSILKEFLNGGWLVPLVGAAAMFARLLSGNSGLSLKQQFKRVLTAAIAAGIAWFVLEQTDVSSLTKAITYGIIGVISPEVISGIVRLGENSPRTQKNLLKNET